MRTPYIFAILLLWVFWSPTNVHAWQAGGWGMVGEPLYKRPSIRGAVAWDGKLVVAGWFQSKAFPGNEVDFICWDGQEWVPMAHLRMTEAPLQMVSFQGSLLAGGGLLGSATQAIRGVAKWNGTVWEPLGARPVGQVHDFAATDSLLLVHGSLTLQVLPQKLLFWDGANWFAPPALQGTIREVFAFNGAHYVFGTGLLDGSVSTDLIMWDSDLSVWIKMAAPEHLSLSQPAVADGNLYFISSWADPPSPGEVTRWNGEMFEPLPPLPHHPTQIHAMNGLIYAEVPLPTGKFQIMVYDGEWTDVGNPLDAKIAVMLEFDGNLALLGSFLESGDAFLGGAAAVADGHIVPLGDQIMGGPSGFVEVAEPYRSGMAFGGDFTHAGGNIFANVLWWDGEEFHAMGNGLSHPPEKLATVGNVLYAAVIENPSYGNRHRKLYRYDGEEWATVPVPSDRFEIEDMIEFKGKLLVAGYIHQNPHGSGYQLLLLEGESWAAFPTQAPNEEIRAFGYFQGDLVAGGEFTQIGGVAANYVARYRDGVWEPLGEGFEDHVQAFFSSENYLVADVFSGGNELDHEAWVWDGVEWQTIGNQEQVRGVPRGFVDRSDLKMILGHFLMADSMPVIFTTVRLRDGKWEPSVRTFGDANTYYAVLGDRLVAYGQSFWDIDGKTVWGLAQFDLTLVPGPFSLIFPTGNEEVNTLNPVLRWTASQNATNYRAWWSYEPDFGVQTEFASIVETQVRVDGIRSGPLEPGRTIYWRVQAEAPADQSAFQAGQFRTSSTAVNLDETSPEIPTELVLHPSYPNPFNPATTVLYDLPQASQVRIWVTDVMGRTVVELRNAMQSAGRHQQLFDAQRLASGIYFVNLRASDRVLRQKVTLMK